MGVFLMAKKMSIEEILAAARANKTGASPPAPAAPSQSAPESAPPAVEPSPASESPAAAATPKPAAKPAGKMSMSEILAAARASKPGAAPVAAKPAPAPKPAEKPVEKPAAAEKTTAKPAPAKAAAPGAAAPKDTASILAAARKGAKPGPMSKSEAAAKSEAPAPVAKKKIEVPPMPARPALSRPAAPAAPAATTRRGFMAAVSAAAGFAFGTSLAIGFSSLVITHLMWVLGLARFMFPNILIEPPTRFKVGFPDSLSPGQVETKFIPQFGVWVVRYEFDGQPMIFAIKSVCTHLGCTPNWLEAEQKFKCPCHGSGFYKDGVNFEGPAPRPLERYAISMADDGQLLVDKSRTFQQELGQWKDASSFVPV